MGIFSNTLFKKDDKKPEEEKEGDSVSQKPEETVTYGPKKISLRSLNGKFASKTSQEAEKSLEPTKESNSLPQSNSLPKKQISIFYGQPIRKFSVDTIWWFCLEDILTLTKMIDIPPFIKSLKDNEAFSDTIQSIDGETPLECITYEGFLALLPLIRETDALIPGPFPDWLKQNALQKTTAL